MKHGYQSACDPNLPGRTTHETFSISFFQIVPNAKGDGTKRKPIDLRLKGRRERRDEIFATADKMIQELDAGWVPEHKTYTYK